MSNSICCPHCGGTGTVPEDFPTGEHVAVVTAEYCEIFNKDYGYGVETYADSYSDDHTVDVKVDTSARSCYSFEVYRIPKEYFTRDREKRHVLMLMHKAEADQAEKDKEKARKKQALLDAERRVAILRGEISVGNQ